MYNPIDHMAESSETIKRHIVPVPVSYQTTWTEQNSFLNKNSLRGSLPYCSKPWSTARKIFAWEISSLAFPRSTNICWTTFRTSWTFIIEMFMCLSFNILLSNSSSHKYNKGPADHSTEDFKIFLMPKRNTFAFIMWNFKCLYNMWCGMYS